jgi:acetyl-CoA synthetase
LLSSATGTTHRQTARKMRGGYLFTGDLGWVDGDGFLWFKSRADGPDKIIRLQALALGDRAGPEQPTQLWRSRRLSASQTRKTPSRQSIRGPQAWVRARRGTHTTAEAGSPRENWAHATPREVEFVNEIPRTATLKIKRSELRNRS